MVFQLFLNIFLLFLIVIHSSCVMNNRGKISSYSFSAERYSATPYLCDSCFDKIKQDFLFEISHSSGKVDLSEYRFVILLNGKSIYSGNFSRKILIKDVCFCNGSNLSRIYTLSFIAIDPATNIGYVWDKKQSFYLSRYNKANIVLEGDSPDDGYKVRFN